MTREPLFIEWLRGRLTWRWWAVLHIAALLLQWATVSAAPIVMQNANAQGWWAVCVTAKGP